MGVWWRFRDGDGGKKERRGKLPGQVGGKPQWADGWDGASCQRRQPGDRLVIGLPSYTAAHRQRQEQREGREVEREDISCVVG